jgi:hypothetical protein
MSKPRPGGQHAQHGQVGIGLDSVANAVVQRFQRRIQILEPTGKGLLRINVERRPVRGSQFADGRLLAIKLVLAVKNECIGSTQFSANLCQNKNPAGVRAGGTKARRGYGSAMILARSV